MELHPLIHFEIIPIFNIMVIVGLITAILLYIHNSKYIDDNKYKKEDVIIYFGLSFIIGIIISNTSNLILFPEYHYLPIIQRAGSIGYTFYFGLIGFIFSLYILLKLTKYNYTMYFNEIVPSITLFHMFGRIGCLLGGCCFGKTCNYLVFSIKIDRFPVREIEVLFLLLMTIVFQTIIKKNRFIIYLSMYSLLRFFIEYQRGDARGHLISNYFSPSQEISIIIFGIIIVSLIVKKYNKISVWFH